MQVTRELKLTHESSLRFIRKAQDNWHSICSTSGPQFWVENIGLGETIAAIIYYILRN